MARYPLRFGMSGIAWFGEQGPPQVTEYRIQPDTEYPVLSSSRKDDPRGDAREVGKATAGGPAEDRWVEFDTDLRNPRFYSVWRVDRTGVANLDRILLVSD